VNGQPQSLVRALKSHFIGGIQLMATQKMARRKKACTIMPAFSKDGALAREEYFGDCTQPDDDRYGSWIGVA
jgi:hypothetical protein